MIRYMNYLKSILLSFIFFFQFGNLFSQIHQELLSFESANPFSLNDIIDNLENNTKSLLCTITRNIVADDAIISIQFSSDMKVWYDGKFLSDSLLSQQKSSISWKSNSIDIDSVKQNFARLKIEIR